MLQCGTAGKQTVDASETDKALDCFSATLLTVSKLLTIVHGDRSQCFHSLYTGVLKSINFRYTYMYIICIYTFVCMCVWSVATDKYVSVDNQILWLVCMVIFWWTVECLIVNWSWAMLSQRKYGSEDVVMWLVAHGVKSISTNSPELATARFGSRPSSCKICSW